MGVKQRGHANFQKFHLSAGHRRLRILATAAYFVALAVYLIIGFQPAPAEAETGASTLTIPAISLQTPVSTVQKDGATLPVPNKIAGQYSITPSKTLIIGHSSGVFQQLPQLQTDDTLTLDDTTYRVTQITTQAKSEIDMSEILSPADRRTLIIMTCAGEKLTATDYSHRLLVEAVAE